MAKPKLTELLKDVQTMSDAFGALKGIEILQDPKLGQLYIPLEARTEFVILEDVVNRVQLLHPYGTSVAYYIH